MPVLKTVYGTVYDRALVVVRVAKRCGDIADVGEVGLVERLDQPGVDQLEQASWSTAL